jgi:hypothetical protein
MANSSLYRKFGVVFNLFYRFEIPNYGTSKQKAVEKRGTGQKSGVERPKEAETMQKKRSRRGKYRWEPLWEAI